MGGFIKAIASRSYMTQDKRRYSALGSQTPKQTPNQI